MSDFDYEIHDGTATIVKYVGAGEDVTVPDMIDGLPVTAIADYAFHNCTSLTHITLPNSITTIGDYALEGCTSLNHITLLNSSISIGHQAFFGCAGLLTIIRIGDDEIFDCPHWV